MNLINKTFFEGKLLRASLILAVFSLLSRFSGLVRDRILASRFGASDILDVYYISFNIPDLIFNLIVVGAVSSAFIPVFIERRAKDENEAWGLANNFLNLIVIMIAFVSAVSFFFIPFIINILAPGFSWEKKEMAVLFTRVMLVSPIIFSASMIIGSILQSFKRFLVYSIAPILYNAGIIIGAVFFEPKFGPLGLAEGVVLGAMLHFLIQVPAVFKTGFRWNAAINFKDKYLKKIFTLMVPRTLGLAAMQVNWIITNAVATTIAVGSVAILNFANNLQYVPIAFVGLSVAVASFPVLSEEALAEDKKNFSSRISKTLKQILTIIIPLSAMMIYLREDIVRIILGAGNFKINDIKTTAEILGIFGIGIFAQGIIPFLSRSFYAMQNTKIPVISAVASVLVNIGLIFYFIKFFSWQNPIFVLPLAFSISGILNVLILFWFLGKKLPQIKIISILGDLFKTVLISGIMYLAIYYFDRLVFSGIRFSYFWTSLGHAFILSLFGLFIFWLLSFKTKNT